MNMIGISPLILIAALVFAASIYTFISAPPLDRRHAVVWILVVVAAIIFTIA